MPTQVTPINFVSDSLEVKADEEETPDSSKWKTFATNTTLHGLRNVVETKHSVLRRVIWLIFISCSAGYYAYFVFLCITNYLSLPIQTIISQESAPADGMDFPAVTICNSNIFMKSKIDLANNHKRFREMGLNISDVVKQELLVEISHAAKHTCVPFPLMDHLL